MKLMPFHVTRRTLTFALCILSFFAIDRSAWAQSALPAIFVCHNIETNPQFNNYAAVTSFTVNPDGTVNYVGNYDTNDNPGALSISPNGRFLAVTHASSNAPEDLIVYKINSDASLTMWAVILTPDSPLDVEWVSNDVVVACQTNSGGANFVHAYRFAENNPIHSRLTLIDSEQTGAFTAYLQRHPTGQFLYASDSPLNGGGNKIRSFAVNPDGTLTFIEDEFIGSYPLDMSISNDGTKLYSAGGIGSLAGGNNHLIHGFLTEGTNGIAPMIGTPFQSPGDSVAHVAVTGDDRFLLAGHGGDGDVRSFLISPEDGFLTDTGFMVSVGGQGDIGAMTTIGRFLLVTRRYSSTGNPSGLLVYHINQNGSFVNVGGIIDTHGTASDAVAAWRPPVNSQGDINGDGLTNLLDIPALIAVMLGTPLDQSHVARADLTADGLANGRDIHYFVNYLLHPTLTGGCCIQDYPCFVTTQIECQFEPGAPWIGGGTTCAQCGQAPPQIFDVIPDNPSYCNSPGSQANFTITGANFDPAATAVLASPGQTSLLPVFISVLSSDTIVAGFDVSGAAPGPWHIEVTNPDLQIAVSPVQHPIQACP